MREIDPEIENYTHRLWIRENQDKVKLVIANNTKTYSQTDISEESHNEMIKSSNSIKSWTWLSLMEESCHICLNNFNLNEQITLFPCPG